MPGYSDRKGPISQEESDKFAEGLNGPDRFKQLMDMLGIGGQQAAPQQPIPQPIQQPTQNQGMNLDPEKEAAFKRALMGK